MSSRVPQRHDFTIYQGATFSYPFYWYDGDPVIKAITAITLGYPAVLTAAGHGLPTTDTRAKLKSIVGPVILNTVGDETVYVRKVTGDTFSVPSVNACGQSAFVAGCGYLVYTPPKDLTGYTARMQIRKSLSSTTVLLTCDDIYNVVMGGAEGSITIELTAAETAALNFSTALYDLELIAADGEVTRLAEGVVTLSKEVTR